MLQTLLKGNGFSSKVFAFSFISLIVAQVLDGLTTRIGLGLGLAEVGSYAMPVLGSYGFWGLMAWKFGLLAFLIALVAGMYLITKRYAPTRLRYVSIILAAGLLIASLGTIQIVISNTEQILGAIHA